MTILIPLEPMIHFLAQHPAILVVLIIVLLSILFSLFKKLLKAAVVLILIFIAANAIVLYFADKEWAKKGKKFLRQTTEEAKEVITKEGNKILRKGEELLTDSSSVVEPQRKKRK